MDGTPQGQNGQNKNDAKPQLSWSQPVMSTPPNKQPQNSLSHGSEKSAPVVQNAVANHTFRNAAITIVLIAVVGGVAASIISNRNKNHDTGDASMTATSTHSTTTTSTTIPSSTNSGGLSVAPQPAGMEVSATADVSAPTWVVVYESRNGQISNILGAALFFPGQASGKVELLRGTMPNQTYFVGEARDDGDHKFSLVKDNPVLDADGNPLLVQFQTN